MSDYKTFYPGNPPTWVDGAGNIMVRKDGFDEVLEALKDLFDSTADVDRYFSKDAEEVFEKAKGVIAKFEKVQS
jgi:hypothetical protein